MKKEDEKYKDKVNEMQDYSGSQILVEDYIGESFIKVFPYRAIYGNEKKVLLQENTFTIVKLSQQADAKEKSYIGYKLDREGNRYFDAFAMYDNAGKMVGSTNTTNTVKKLDIIKSFNLIGNFRLEIDEHKPDFFTIGEPFSQEKYDKGEQRMYFLNGVEELSLDTMKGLIGDIDNIEQFEHLHAFSLNDVRMLTHGSRSQFKFVLTLGSLKDPKITTIDGEDIAGIKLTIDNHSLLNSVKAKGILEANPNSITDIDFKCANNLAPFKMTPILNDNKLTMYAPWFDNNSVIDYNLYNHFKIPITLFESGAQKYDNIKLLTTNFVLHKNGVGSVDFDINITHEKKNNKLVYITFQQDDFNIKDIKNNNGTLTKHYTTFDNNDYNEGGTLTITVTDTKVTIKIEGYVDHYYDGEDNFNAGFEIHGLYYYISESDNNTEKLLEDLLIVSAGFLDEWKHAKMKNDSGEWKIDPSFRIGHSGILVSTIINQRPQNVIDKMILSFLNNNPSVRTDVSQFVYLTSMIGALSKYILSDIYTFKQGGNDLNQIMTPWYLELKAGSLSYTNEQSLVVAQPGIPTQVVKSSLLPGVQYIQNDLFSLSTNTYGSVTQYYKDNYGQLNNFESNYAKSEQGLVVPKDFNISNIKLIDTDRKTILSKLDESIDMLDINFVAGENDGSEKYMKYLFHLPVSLSILQSIYKNNNKVVHKSGDELTVFIPPTGNGQVFHKNDDAIKNHVRQTLDAKYGVGAWQLISKPTWGYVEGFHGFIAKNSVESAPPYNFLETEDGTMMMNSKAVWDATSTEPICGSTTGGSGGTGWCKAKLTEDKVKQALANIKNVDIEAINQWSLPDGAGWWWVKAFDYHDGNGLRGAKISGFDSNLDYSIEYISFHPIKISFTRNVNLGEGNEGDVNEINKRQVTFDKSDWQKFIYSYVNTPTNTTKLLLYEKNKAPIQEITEIEISSLWGDHITIEDNSMAPITIELNNREDETIGVERIAFF